MSSLAARDALAHTNARAVTCLGELDLVHEGEHERNPSPALREGRPPRGLDEGAAVRDLNFDDTLAPFHDDLHRTFAFVLLDRVAERLGRRQPEVEALCVAQAGALCEGVDGRSKLGRRAGPASKTEFDARALLDATNTPSVPTGVPNCVNGSNAQRVSSA